LTANEAQLTLKLWARQLELLGEFIKYTTAIAHIKTLLNWSGEIVELKLIDVEPCFIWFEGNALEAQQREAPRLRLCMKVGQKWREWDEVSCEWQEGRDAHVIGLRPLWGEDQKREFKKYLELTLSI